MSSPCVYRDIRKENRESVSMKKQLLFGYSKSKTDDYIVSLLEEKEGIQKKLNYYMDISESLKEQVKVYQSREEEITQILVEARKSADKIILDAKEEADKLMRGVEDDVQQRLEVAEKDIRLLSDLKQQILLQEQSMKHSVEKLLNDYLNAVMSIDVRLLSEQEEEVSDKIEESQETIQKNRKIISFSKEYNNIEKESIPIYNFD